MGNVQLQPIIRGDVDMKVSYKKLWVLCAEKEISKAELRKRAGLSSATFTKLRKNQEVTLSVMLKIAEVMQCNAGDMMDFLPDDKVIPSEEDAE
jgi:DNA-binding Xre family transcriptional regulator